MMAKKLPIIARTNKSGLDLLTVHKSQTLVLPGDGTAPDCDVALTLHSDAQEIIDSLYEALFRLSVDCKLAGLEDQAGFDCWLKMADEALAKVDGREIQ